MCRGLPPHQRGFIFGIDADRVEIVYTVTAAEQPGTNHHHFNGNWQGYCWSGEAGEFRVTLLFGGPSESPSTNPGWKTTIDIWRNGAMAGTRRSRRTID